MATAWAHRYAQRTKRMSSSVIREILKLTQQPDIISFAGGLPSPDVFPIEEFKQACDVVLSEQGKQALQYSITEGYPPLREWVVQRSSRYGINIDIDNVLITSGSQQALDLLGKVFIDPGDHVLVEGPTFLGALQAWNAYGAEYFTQPLDDDGLVIEGLEKVLAEKPNFMYVLPNFHNPAGVTLSGERRKQIVELAHQYDVPIVEDDPYGQLRYSGEHIPPLVVYDDQCHGEGNEKYCGNVIYTSTFSKILAPGIRLAWVIAPKDVIRKMVQAKQGTDLHTSIFTQMVVYEIGRDGFLDRHAKTIRAVYGERRDLMLAAMEEHFPPNVTWTKPEGGLFLWVRLPEGVNAQDVLEAAIEKKVAFVPGAPFFPYQGGENTLRLNFSNASHEQIVEGIKRLGEVLHQELAETSKV